MLDFETVYFIPLCIAFLASQLFMKTRPIDLLLRGLIFVYFIAVVSLTLFPIPIDGVEDFINAGVEPTNNFIPFGSILDIASSQPFSIALRQIGGNIVLFMPLGFLVPLIWKGIKWSAVLEIGLLCSFAIEAIQFTLSYALGYTYKITDVDDLILNASGTMMGYILYRIFQWGFKGFL